MGVTWCGQKVGMQLSSVVLIQHSGINQFIQPSFKKASFRRLLT